MTPSTLDPTTTSILQTLSEWMPLLQQTLEKEKSLMADRFEPTDLEAISQEKQQLLERIDDGFTQLIHHHNITIPKASPSISIPLFDQLVQRIGNTEQLTQLKTLITLCHDLNRRNGITLQMIQRQNQMVLHILTGKQMDTVQNTYNATGKTTLSNPSQMNLGKA